MHSEICRDLKMAVVDNKQLFKYILSLCRIERHIEWYQSCLLWLSLEVSAGKSVFRQILVVF